MSKKPVPAPRARPGPARLPGRAPRPAKAPGGGRPVARPVARPRTLRDLADAFLAAADDLRYRRISGREAEITLRSYEAVLKAFELRIRYGDRADKPWG